MKHCKGHCKCGGDDDAAAGYPRVPRDREAFPPWAWVLGALLAALVGAMVLTACGPP